MIKVRNSKLINFKLMITELNITFNFNIIILTNTGKIQFLLNNKTCHPNTQFKMSINKYPYLIMSSTKTIMKITNKAKVIIIMVVTYLT